MPEAKHDDSLRQEIIESQKTQADFLKWKLITVAAVASISLGLQGGDGAKTDSAKFLLCLIPLLCGYVDLISLHVMIRIITIGVYLRVSGNTYEDFVFKVRDKAGANPFILEQFALHGSSLLFNALIVVLGCCVPLMKWPGMLQNAYIVSGLLGLLWMILLWVIYILRERDVRAMGENLKVGKSSP